MPTIPLMQLPKSRSAEEFENMCADVLGKIYKGTFVPFGRQGQKQNGIDLIGSEMTTANIVAQCKNYFSCSYEKLQEQLRNDIESVTNLSFPIRTFIGMTSLNRDTETQSIVLNLNASFEIKMMFWEDIQSILCGDPRILKKYYPNYFTDYGVPINYKNEIISNAILLKQQARILSSNFSNYAVATNYENDVALYNICVSMVKAMAELYQLHDQWYFQLKEARITKPIENLIENRPSFYQETEYGTGGEMICTIVDFLNYFADDDKRDKFIKRCNKIIKRTEEI